MGDEFSKVERKQLRSLAGEIYEAEAAALLGELETSFKEWRAGKRVSSDLLQEIHEFHQHQVRELWARYQALKRHEIVARGVALRLIEGERIDPVLRAKLQRKIAAFESLGRA